MGTRNTHSAHERQFSTGWEDSECLKIQDNSWGFSMETARKGMGLSNVRERAELSGAVSTLNQPRVKERSYERGVVFD